MRKTLRPVLTLVLAFVLVLAVSCSQNSYDAFYGYFENEAFVIVYSRSDNMLYEINLPVETLLLWGSNSGLESIPVAMRNFTGLSDSAFLAGTYTNLKTARDILDSLIDKQESNPENRLLALCTCSEVLSKKPLSDTMNRLCTSDFSKLVSALKDKRPEIVCYDARTFINSQDLNFSQQYFRQWLEQVLGGK